MSILKFCACSLRFPFSASSSTTSDIAHFAMIIWQHSICPAAALRLPYAACSLTLIIRVQSQAQIHFICFIFWTVMKSFCYFLLLNIIIANSQTKYYITNVLYYFTTNVIATTIAVHLNK